MTVALGILVGEAVVAIPIAAVTMVKVVVWLHQNPRKR